MKTPPIVTAEEWEAARQPRAIRRPLRISGGTGTTRTEPSTKADPRGPDGHGTAYAIGAARDS